ncbi:MAG: hypothetical protein NT015_17700 [Alphaproteobacteria bacterium]|nr:hypothetical protein [Alphaproteobacteria bacterium]
MPPFDLAPGKNTQRGFWGTDFQLVDGYVHVKSTGTRFKNDWQLWADIWRWFTYYAFVRLHGFWAHLTKPRGPRIWFAPYRPRPWYIIWAAMVWGGFEFAPTPERADAAFYFEDQTIAKPPPPRHAKAFNFGVGDVSKSNVARVMEEAFGYPLAIDPTTFVGEAVEKGEGNGLHDGRLVTCPLSPKQGQAYQRVIKTEGADGWAHDLRTACVGGEPVVVFVKQKPASARFSIQNTSVVVKTPEEVFSPDEIAQLKRFLTAMKLDWGGLDVLREHSTGRLYVVDVNKTDTGPAVVLNWRDRTKATTLLSNALRKMVSA